MHETVQEMLYRGRKNKDIHHVRPGERVLIMIHQTHKGEPHVNTFTVSTYPCPEDITERDNLIAGLFLRKENLSGYTRIFIADMID